MIKIHFCYSKGIVGVAIRAATFSNFNHVAVELNGTIYHATFSNGVHKIPADGFTDHYHKVETHEIHGLDEEKAKEWLESHLGAGYDWKALVAMPFRENWQEPDRWFCSEYGTGLMVALEQLGDCFEESRITPEAFRVMLLVRQRVVGECKHSSASKLHA